MDKTGNIVAISAIYNDGKDELKVDSGQVRIYKLKETNENSNNINNSIKIIKNLFKF